MKQYVALGSRCVRRGFRMLGGWMTSVRLWIMLFINQVEHRSIHCNGMPYFCVSPSGCCIIGDHFSINNGLRFNPIGYPQPCIIYVGNNANLVIGKNVGISQTSIICHYHIEIKDNVKCGGGVKIFDTDFHSVYPEDRLSHAIDMEKKRMAKVLIGNNVFLGAGSIILKGVRIGDNAVIGAGSVVTKSIPSNEIWAGNPARFIRKID